MSQLIVHLHVPILLWCLHGETLWLLLLQVALWTLNMMEEMFEPQDRIGFCSLSQPDLNLRALSERKSLVPVSAKSPRVASIVFWKWTHAQYNRIQERWSKVDESAMVSAEVLVTTFWIFRQPQVSGLIRHWQLLLISLWVPTIIDPAWESGLLLEEKEASEKAINRKSLGGIGLMVIVTSW